MVAPANSCGITALKRRLLDHLRQRVKNGEYTERGLSRAVGLSQPHIHNLLKGSRWITGAAADQLMDALGLNALDFGSADELGHAMRRKASVAGVAAIPVARGRLGPEDPFPDLYESTEWVLSPLGSRSQAIRPVLVEAGDDPALATDLSAARFYLLDIDESARVSCQPVHWYAVRHDGRGCVRQVQRDTGVIRLRGQRLLPTAAGRPIPDNIDLGRSGALHFLRARVCWAGPDPRRFAAFDWSGTSFQPRSAAS
jgi:hypothetical protein